MWTPEATDSGRTTENPFEAELNNRLVPVPTIKSATSLALVVVKLDVCVVCETPPDKSASEIDPTYGLALSILAHSINMKMAVCELEPVNEIVVGAFAMLLLR